MRGEPDSDRFLAGYERLLQIADDLLAEGTVAHGAGARHHAGWSLKAVDLVLARLALALAAFRAARPDWPEVLHTARPEYEPRYPSAPNCRPACSHLSRRTAR